MSVRILGICGSLRAQSFNHYLLNAAQEHLPSGGELLVFTLDGIPPFNQDNELQPPPKVTALKQAIRSADALLIASPEYNYSVPGVLKNAIDWATRPYGDNPFKDKPAAIMGATIGGMGTSRAQYHLRQILTGLNVHTLTQPELMLSSAAERFDDQGRLTCSKTAEHLEKLLLHLSDWTQQLQRGATQEATHG